MAHELQTESEREREKKEHANTSCYACTFIKCLRGWTITMQDWHAKEQKKIFGCGLVVSVCVHDTRDREFLYFDARLSLCVIFIIFIHIHEKCTTTTIQTYLYFVFMLLLFYIFFFVLPNWTLLRYRLTFMSSLGPDQTLYVCFAFLFVCVINNCIYF